MPQLSLYLTQEQLSKLASQAKRENLSLSKWVATRIIDTIEPAYPKNWLELFASVSDPSFERPSQPPPGGREEL